MQQRRFTITAKLAAIVVVFVAVIAALLALIYGAFYVNAGVRAYVNGEGLWSKGQKDALYYIARYIRTLDARDLDKYERAIRIPQGDHIARMELIKPYAEFDYDVAARGFIQGMNAPQDVGAMIFLFRYFHDVPYLAKAIGIWSEADPYLEQLTGIADRARGLAVQGPLTPGTQEALLADLERINASLTPLEQNFSATMVQGARGVGQLLLQEIFIVAAMLLTGGLWVSLRISRGLRDSILELREGTLRVGRGDLAHPIRAGSQDELGDLAAAFNDMVAHRKTAEGVLHSEREFLKTLLESLTEGIVACDEHGMLTLFNRATREMHGLPQEELAPDKWADYYDLYLADGVTKMKVDEIPLFRAFRGERLREVEMVIAPKNCPRRVLVCNGGPIVDASGKTMGAVVALRDVTEAKQAALALQDHAEELQRSNAELERFAYVASHDLQEPLRTVASYTQLLTRRFGDLAGAAEFVGHIVDGVHRMRDLIEGLLAYSRVAQPEEKQQSVELDHLLDAALANLKGAIDESGAAVVREPLPTLKVTPHLFTQLLQNLVGNAIKFRADKAPEISIRAWRVGTDWMFSVRDNGIGIDAQYADKIFVLFQRLHTREAYPGSGIGLAICKKIVERHGGAIWVEPGGPGAEFRFTLPAV